MISIATTVGLAKHKILNSVSKTKNKDCPHPFKKLEINSTKSYLIKAGRHLTDSMNLRVETRATLSNASHRIYQRDELDLNLKAYR